MLIALGSVIVIVGIVFYILEIFGAMGMILIGILTELGGGIIFLKERRKHKKRKP